MDTFRMLFRRFYQMLRQLSWPGAWSQYLDSILGSVDANPTKSVPQGLTAVAIVMILACVVGSPWLESPLASLITALVTRVSFFPLIGLAWQVRSQATDGWKDLRQERQMIAGLHRHTPTILATLLGDRQDAVARVAGRPVGHAPQPMGEILEAGQNLSAVVVLEEVRQRYVGGDDIRIEDLAATLRQHEGERLDPLLRSHELALALGFAGTLIGLIVQGFIAQNVARGGLFSQAFLMGSLLAVTTTLVGLLIAAYARAARWQVLQDFEPALSRVRQWLSFDILPACDARSRLVLDLSGVFEQTVEGFRETVWQMGADFRQTVKQMGQNLEARVEARTDHAINNIGDFTMNAIGAIRDHAASEMARAAEKMAEVTEDLRTQVSEPFQTEMGKLSATIKDAAHSISEGSNALSEGSNALKEITEQLSRELHRALREPGQLTRELQTARGEMTFVTSQLGTMAVKLDEMVPLLEQAAAQMSLSLANLYEKESRRTTDGRNSTR